MASLELMDGAKTRLCLLVLQLALDRHKLFVYYFGMIRNFASTETEQFFASGKSRRFPPDILKRAAMRLTQLDAATRIEDLRLPPSNRLEALSHDRVGQWSIASTTNGACASALNMAMLTMLKSLITIKEKQHG